MSTITILFGAALIGLGAFGYYGGDPSHRSVTAWIPAFFGAPLLLCGLLALNDKIRKHAMHAAVLVATLGAVLAGGRGLMKIGVLFSDEPKRAVTIVLIMAGLCVVFVVLCVNSFIAARKRRQASEASEASE